MSPTNVPTKLSNLTDIIVTNTAPSFLVGGVVTTNVGSQEGGNSVTLQADGKILLGGQFVEGLWKSALLRYNADGSLDTSFGENGKVIANHVGYGPGNFVAVQADGKILLGGASGFDFILARYNTDGSLDADFNGDDKINTGLDGNYSFKSITVQADGKILLGGRFIPNSNSSHREFLLVRYNTDGSLDLSFDGDGIVTTDVGEYGGNGGESVTVQADGKILLGGEKSGYFALVRYNTDGSLDADFDSDGIAVTTDATDGYSGNHAIAVQADGKILLGGSSSLHRDSGAFFTLVRYHADGRRDVHFGGDGKVITVLNGKNDSVTVQADGKILVGGSRGGDFALVRYNLDGSLDLSFGGDGLVTTDSNSIYDSGKSVAVQADGKILLGGDSNDNFALVRYNADGSLDNSFNSNSFNTLNGETSYFENSTAIVLDNAAQIYDAELAAQGNYKGASITLARHGGANVEDVFSGSGQLSFNGNDGILSGVIIGTLSNSNGTLTINFNSDATQARVDAVLSSIAYNNTTDNPPTPTDTTPPVSVQIDWIFNDGNTGTQGIGDALTTTGSSIINIDKNLDEVLGTTKNDNFYVGAGGKGYGFTGNDYLNSYFKRYNNYTDTLVGGKGNDTYVISNKDVVIENQNEGTDTIISRHSIYILPANVENLTFHLGGQKSFNGKGNDLANTIIGGNRDDRLSGGAGADTLTGGYGADIFKFNKATETGITATTRDTLVDFSHDQGDKINLAAIDANTALKGNNAFAAPTVGGAFSGTFANSGELYFDQTAHILYGNNDADSTADFSIIVMGVSSLVATDFVL